MFSKVVFVSSVLAVVLALPPSYKEVPIISKSEEVNPDGSFQWSYESADGSSQQQSGHLKEIGQEAGEVVQGSASWVDPSGGQHQISYVADENGYQPQSADLPVGPEVPSQILRALEWNAAHPQPEDQQ